MKSINIETLKPGDQIFAFDSNLLTWSKCKIIQIEKYLVTLENIEGSLKGFAFYEIPEVLENFDHYRIKIKPLFDANYDNGGHRELPGCTQSRLFWITIIILVFLGVELLIN